MQYITQDSLVPRHRVLAYFAIVLFATAVCASSAHIIGHQIAPLPARFGIGDRAPDFTAFEDLARGRAPFHKVVTGDFNGDGIGDLLITNSLAAGSSQGGAGSAYVILGKRSFGSPASLNLASQQPDLTILGPSEFSQLGISATTGDVNGDGIDDIILCAINVTAPGGRLTGAIYVVFGSKVFNSAVIDLSRTHADVTIFGATVLERLDPGVAVGDINGDGAKDLIFRQSQGGPERVSILLGPLAAGTVIDLATTQADVVISGPPGLNGFGDALAVGDVNGDGIPDLVIGDPSFAGTVDIVMGSSRFKRGVKTSLSRTQSDATIVGALTSPDMSGDGLGGVISIGDVNSDGIDDIVLGVPASIRLGNGLGPTSAGEAYVVFGSRSLSGRLIDIGQGQQDLTIQGTAATAEANSTEFGALLGFSLVARDIDGDGITDLVLGAPGAGGVKDTGQAYVILGSSELTSGAVIKTSEIDQDITILGQEKGAHLGTVVASGDLNGDSVTDLILEADDAETPGGSQQGTGAIYIYFGAKVRPPEITKARFKGGASRLQITGTDFTGDVRVEINGMMINSKVTFLPDEGRLILNGTRQELNLNSDPNQVVVIRKGTRSNVARVKG